eukprot:CAMPEP_0182943060 /NCGR_PEP_ID=MMETSP0105_2-20130417/51779_1 /TAXON_ID=81532 ORGANISM="Acanthoeca-like sp., Strain 10tr" /NCGR_SAMPLE_ID=MMETSP0105_2 /ASSEMBLY_ACC=CAM_ASM_000205 /LENGTH=48 /DNA_ID= /DNA_START= /DNA_END= /DNA_ORIENTATION=
MTGVAFLLCDQDLNPRTAKPEKIRLVVIGCEVVENSTRFRDAKPSGVS